MLIDTLHAVLFSRFRPCFNASVSHVNGDPYFVRTLGSVFHINQRRQRKRLRYLLFYHKDTMILILLAAPSQILQNKLRVAALPKIEHCLHDLQQPPIIVCLRDNSPIAHHDRQEIAIYCI